MQEPTDSVRLTRERFLELCHKQLEEMPMAIAKLVNLSWYKSKGFDLDYHNPLTRMLVDAGYIKLKEIPKFDTELITSDMWHIPEIVQELVNTYYSDFKPGF
jgi:hypothetical protein